jgi:excinuclease ABC subunit B
MKQKFKLVSKFKPKGDQPKAIQKLVDGYNKYNRQVLQGITGSGKTFSIANVIEQINKPTLVLSHNKTLAFQLYSELKGLFPNNRVEYFISYFDYYQPESYMPQTDTYVEKDSRVNKQIEMMRLKSTASLLSRNDVIIVSSISCIYGIGSPSDWRDMAFKIKVGDKLPRKDLYRNLVAMQYERNDIALEPGRFRVRGNTTDIILGYEKNIFRINFLGDRVARISELDFVSSNKIATLDELMVFPARHYVVPEDRIDKAVESIEKELDRHAPTLPELEKRRVIQRTNYDLEMIAEVGYCKGIENYSSHFENRKIEDPPFCLLDFFPKDFLLVIDESHQSIPQSRAMFHGDRARKKNLIDHGFRLPSAYGNRPLKFEEFEKYFNNIVFVSATPAEYEIESASQIVQQIIRPTGLLDPVVEIKPVDGQVDDLIAQIRKVVKRKNRVLVTTMTKRMAEDLTEYLSKAGIRVRYLHSEIDTIQRTEIIRQLRLGEFDVLVGINLLREGLDIPEVEFVGVLDADQEGFLRDERSLIQIIGRASRNDSGRVILYANKITKSIKNAVEITITRRAKQQEYNKKYGITPKTIIKSIPDSQVKLKTIKHLAKGEVPKMIAQLESDMIIAADNLEFEKAIELRGQLKCLRDGQGNG